MAAKILNNHVHVTVTKKSLYCISHIGDISEI